MGNSTSKDNDTRPTVKIKQRKRLNSKGGDGELDIYRNEKGRRRSLFRPMRLCHRSEHMGMVEKDDMYNTLYELN